MSKKKFYPIDLSKVRTNPLEGRYSKASALDFGSPVGSGASFAGFLNSFPQILKGKEFREFVEGLCEVVRSERTVAVGLGAHVVKCGLNPHLIDLMRRGWIHALAINGATAIHDVEVALVGQTSEEVIDGLEDGSFGMAERTGEILNQSAKESSGGLGVEIGERLVSTKAPNASSSILAAAFELGIPATVHVAIGTDIVHQQPGADGEAIGRASFHDFRTFCSVVASLEGGAYLNFGSAVILPEVFLKALTVARNLGNTVDKFITANFDQIQHYRPGINVVERPVSKGGKGYRFTGHHEFLIPQLCQALHEALGDRVKAARTKIMTLQETCGIRERIRGIGGTVVFTNGCFDLIHRGHMEYLQRARSLGSFLILGLNNDTSVARLKGEGRPILPLEDRAGMLAGLECVDAICVFEEDTPQKLIESVRPDVLVKGGDYGLDEIVGREAVERAGGKVITIPMVEGRSTTDIIRMIREKSMGG